MQSIIVCSILGVLGLPLAYYLLLSKRYSFLLLVLGFPLLVY